MKYHCNQCGGELKIGYRLFNQMTGETFINFEYCSNPACPNFALLQIPVELFPVKRDLEITPSTGKGGGE